MLKKKLALKKGFTLIELIVAIGIIAILTGMGVKSYSSLIKRVKEASAQTNLAAVNVALNMHKKDEGVFPEDGAAGDLAGDLAEYEVGGGILTNPYNGKSCASLYVKRTADAKAEDFIMAVPDVKRDKTTVLLLGSEPQVLTLKEVTYQGTAVEPGDTVTLSGGNRLDFGDGTTVRKTGGANTTVTLLHSFELDNGTPYGLIRVDDPGKVRVEVTPGWKFEVVTPAAIAGVEGTKFKVTIISSNETDVDVTESSVRVTERTGKGSVLVTAGESIKIKDGEFIDSGV